MEEQRNLVIDNERNITEMRQVCPICGKPKHKDALVCSACRKAGSTAVALAQAAKSVLEAKIAYRKSRGDDGRGRELLLGPIACKIRIPKDAKLNSYPDGTSYLYARIMVDGGFISLNVFGATEEDRGRLMVVLLEMSMKTVVDGQEKRGNVPYITAWVIDVNSETAAPRFHIRKVTERDFTGSLPSYTHIQTLKDIHDSDKNRSLAFIAGFVPIDQPKPATTNAAQPAAN